MNHDKQYEENKIHSTAYVNPIDKAFEKVMEIESKQNYEPTSKNIMEKVLDYMLENSPPDAYSTANQKELVEEAMKGWEN